MSLRSRTFARSAIGHLRRNVFKPKMSKATLATFSEVPRGLIDPMNELKQEFDQDTKTSKVDLGAGVLRDEEGKCYEFPVLQKAKQILEERRLGHDYRPTTGIVSFRSNAARLIFGDNSAAVHDGRIASIQTVAGTGACRLGAVFLNKHWPTTSNRKSGTQVFVGNPTWVNYEPLLEHARFTSLVKTYAYLDESSEIAFENVISTIREAPAQSIFVFQGCCNNPTGLDLTQDQWRQVGDGMLARGHFAFFDIAYQGLGQGLAEDAFGIRHFESIGMDMLVCQSFSKNAGLYAERVGVLHVVCRSPGIATNVLDQLRSLLRWEVSSAPAYGAELVNIVLADETLLTQWQSELGVARDRIRSLRSQLHSLLSSKYATPSPRTGTINGWRHILHENGLFSFTGLSPSKIRSLIERDHVYLPRNGRMNVSGLNASNIDRVARAIDSVASKRS